ncbi:MAG TPA: beta-ACP synthase, partial [Pirellulaceae bacterium]|nr:beta-ACP synthase [Pirellulaceae bacterium]
EWGASLHALESGEIPLTLNYEQPDPRCPIRVVGGAAIRSQRRTAVLLSQSTTGQAAAVVFDAS